MNYQELNGRSIRVGFEQFHRDNPRIYQAFERLAIKALSMGKKKISAKMIVNVIRWEVFVNTTDENFKINDAYHAYYARLFASRHPEFKGVFEFRKLRNEQDGPYMVVEKDGQMSFVS